MFENLDNFYGIAGKLETPITIDLVTYSHFLQFNSKPFSAPENTDTITTATVHSITRSGDYVTIACKRQEVLGSYLTGTGDEGIRKYYVGGNVAETIEPQRFYSYKSPETSIRGCKRGAQAGNTAHAFGRSWVISEATPMAIAPLAISWQDDTAETKVQEITYQHDVITSAGMFDGPLFTRSGLYVYDFYTEDDYVQMIKQDVPTRPDNYTYSLALPLVPQYYRDDDLGVCVLDSRLSVFSNVFKTVRYLPLAQPWQEETGKLIALECVGQGGYGANDDNIGLFSRYLAGDGIKQIRIHKTGLGFGNFLLEYRDSIYSGGAFASIIISNGEILQYGKRINQASNATAGAIDTSVTLDLDDDYFDLYIERDATDIVFYYKKQAGTQIEIHRQTDVALDANGGFVGIALWQLDSGVLIDTGTAEDNAQWQTYSLMPGDDAVSINAYYEERIENIEVDFTHDYTRVSTRPIAQVRNLSTNDLMTEVAGTPETRRQYDLITGNKIVFPSECAGDTIRITYNPELSATAAPGIAPEQNYPNTIGMADGGTGYNDNKANWFDKIVLYDPLFSFDLYPGDEFAIKRRAVFDFKSLPIIQYTYRNAGSATWNTIPTEDYLINPADGVVWLSASFMGVDLGSTDEMCFRAYGNRVIHNGSLPAKNVNILKQALQTFDDLWVRADLVGGFGFNVDAGATLQFGATDVECHGGTCLRPLTYGWGTQPNAMPDVPSYPYVGGGTIYYASAGFTPSSSLIICDTESIEEGDLIQEGLALIGIQFGDITTQAFGSSADFPSDSLQAFFRFRAVGANPPAIITKLPTGTEILEAYSMVDFQNLTSEYGTLSPSGQTFNTGVAGNINFQLIGVNPERRTLRDADGNPTSVRMFRIKSYDVSMTGTASTGPTIYNSQALLEKMLTARNDTYPYMCLWPSVGPSLNLDALASYLMAQFPELPTASRVIDDFDPCVVTPSYEVAWKFFEFDNVSIYNTLMRIRVPSGLLAKAAYPIIRPPHVPY